MASEESPHSGGPALGHNPTDSSVPLASSFPRVQQETPRIKSLKRNRPEQPQNFTLNPISNVGLTASPSPKSPRFKGTFSPALSPAPLTGAAALVDVQRQQENLQGHQQSGMSDNPSHKALSSLIASGGRSMSKPQDAPVATMTISQGMSTAASAISIPSPMQFDDKSETSPASVTSLASLGSAAPTATAGSTIVASPASLTSAIEQESRDSRIGNITQLQLPTEEQSANRALSFPGNLLGRPDAARIPPRGRSLPMPAQTQKLAPRSPSQRKHKCPYCETEFTRHHNLKSHLLTHSQEKPYVCQTCNMRFRRLHDLKRHMKLHTGERPHICPKCDRKFARGDALARHSKGQGGCAGRRASMGSFGGDDDFEGSNVGDADEGMDGVMYTNGTPHPNEAEMTEEERRRFSLPSIKAQHVGNHQGGDDGYSRAPSTYPPAGPRQVQTQSTGGLYPPGSGSSGTSHTSMGGHHTPNTSISSLPLNTAGSSMFSQSAMTESPKPLSPGGMHSHQLGVDSSLSRQRSPSLTTQFQQQHFGRHQSSRASPPVTSLPSPHGSHVPKLPGLASLAPPDQRYTLSSQTPNQPATSNAPHGQQSQQTSGSSSTSPMYQPSQGSGSSRGGLSNSAGPQNISASDSDTNIFVYVRDLEVKLRDMTDRVSAMEKRERSQEERIKQLSAENFGLRSQFANQSQAPTQALQS